MLAHPLTTYVGRSWSWFVNAKKKNLSLTKYGNTNRSIAYYSTRPLTLMDALMRSDAAAAAVRVDPPNFPTKEISSKRRAEFSGATEV